MSSSSSCALSSPPSRLRSISSAGRIIVWAPERPRSVYASLLLEELDVITPRIVDEHPAARGPIDAFAVKLEAVRSLVERRHLEDDPAPTARGRAGLVAS